MEIGFIGLLPVAEEGLLRRADAVCRGGRKGVLMKGKNSPLEERLNSVSFGYEREPLLRGLPGKCAECPRRVRWTCPKGHVINAVEGSPCSKVCPHCLVEDCPLLRRENGVKSRLSLQEFKLMAVEKGGLCLSHKYHNSKTPLRWQCSKGHEWEATPENVRRGSWCPTCRKQERKLTIDDMRKTAQKFGGTCLSETYVNIKEKLTWRCANGHVFEMAPNNIRRFSGSRKPSWCPECSRQETVTSVQQAKAVKTVLKVDTNCTKKSIVSS
mmetsp:Transcript_22261/g.89838  ORF Transcript_22261/g.89838 Transcript_22261/m.89838 type:complete len:269 (-) Transcript_22261:196-1002(-)